MPGMESAASLRAVRECFPATQVAVVFAQPRHRADLRLRDRHPLPRRFVQRQLAADEVIDAGRTLRPGEVYNANGPLIAAWLAQAGYSDVSVEPVADTEAAVRDALSRGLAGVRHRTLIVNLPGSTGGVRDALAALLIDLAGDIEDFGDVLAGDGAGED